MGPASPHRLDGAACEVHVEAEVAAVHLLRIARELLQGNAEVRRDRCIDVHVVEQASVGARRENLRPALRILPR